MNLTNIDIEKSFILLLTLLTLASLAFGMGFSIEGKWHVALFYMTGSLLASQFLCIYYVHQSKRQTIAAVNLLEKNLEKFKTQEENE